MTLNKALPGDSPCSPCCICSCVLGSPIFQKSVESSFVSTFVDPGTITSVGEFLELFMSTKQSEKQPET